MNGWRTATLLLGCALLFAVLAGREAMRERDAVAAYYTDAARTQTRIAEHHRAVREIERQEAIARFDSAVSEYARQRARVKYTHRSTGAAPDAAHRLTTDSVIQEYAQDSNTSAEPAQESPIFIHVPAEYIAAADSVASTCSILRATCDAAMQSADSVIAAQSRYAHTLEAQLKAERKGKLAERISTALLWGATGYVAGRLLRR